MQSLKLSVSNGTAKLDAAETSVQTMNEHLMSIPEGFNVP